MKKLEGSRVSLRIDGKEPFCDDRFLFVNLDIFPTKDFLYAICEKHNKKNTADSLKSESVYSLMINSFT